MLPRSEHPQFRETAFASPPACTSFSQVDLQTNPPFALIPLPPHGYPYQHTQSQQEFSKNPPTKETAFASPFPRKVPPHLLMSQETWFFVKSVSPPLVAVVPIREFHPQIKSRTRQPSLKRRDFFPSHMCDYYLHNSGWQFVEDRLARKFSQSSQRLVANRSDCAADTKKVEGRYPSTTRRSFQLSSVV